VLGMPRSVVPESGISSLASYTAGET
jgi:hypothetical protein